MTIGVSSTSTGAFSIGGSGALALGLEAYSLTLQGGNTAFTNGITLNAAETLNFDLGTGTITSAIGPGTDITADTLTITSSGGVGISGDALTTAVNVLGASTVTGALFVTNAGALDIGGALDAGANAVVLESGGDITQSGGATITAGGLKITTTGGTAVTLNEANAVTTLAANTAGALSYTNNGGLTVGTVDSTVGITTGGTAIDDVTLDVGLNLLTVSDVINATSGTVSLTSNTIDLTAVVTGNEAILLIPDAGATSVGLNDGAGTFNLDAAELVRIHK